MCLSRYFDRRRTGGQAETYRPVRSTRNHAFSLAKVHWFQRIPKYICMLYLLIVIGLGAVDLFSYYHIRKRNETLEKSISRIFNGKGSIVRVLTGKTACS